MTDQADILFVAQSTPDEELFKTISYPWHRLAVDVGKLGFRVRVCAPVELVGLLRLVRCMASIGHPKKYSARMTPSVWVSLFPRWRPVGGVQTLIADRRLYRGIIRQACLSARILHFVTTRDFWSCYRIMGDELLNKTYLVTPRRSCESQRAIMGDLWDKMYEHALAIVYPSESVRLLFARTNHARDALVINHGIEHIWYDTPRCPPPDVGDGTVRLVCACGLIKEKGVMRLIDVVARMPEIRLTIIGEGPQRFSLMKHAAAVCRNGQCVFTGWLSAKEMIPHFDESNVFILPSSGKGETLGLVYLEALARARPILGITGYGVHGMFPNCSNVRLLPADFDETALRHAIRQVMDAQPFELCACGRCSERHVPERTAMKFAEIYRRVLSGGESANAGV